MGAPITWRNVDGPNVAAAVQPMAVAQQSINGAFDQFSKILQQRQAINNANVDAGQDVAKQNYLDALASAKTPDQLAALQQSGQLDDLRAGMGAQTRASVRGADDARQTSVQAAQTAADAFTQHVRGVAEAPVIGAIKDKALRGDTAGAMADLQASNLFDKSGVESFIHDTARSRLDEANKDKLTPLTYDNAVQANAEGKLRLKAATNAAADDAEQRAAESLIATTAAAHSKAISDTRSAIETEAQSVPGLPRNTDGSLAVERMTTDQVNYLNGQLKSQGLPPVESLVGADTKATGALVEGLKQQFRPSIIAKVTPMIPGVLSTSAPTPIGSDADAAQHQIRTLQAEEGMANDRFGTISGQGDTGNLMKVGSDVINSVTNPMTGGRERYNQALGEFLQKGGIPVKDANGKPTGEHVLPSENQLRTILGQISTGWFRNTKADVGDLLQNWANSPEAQAGAAELVRIRDRNRLLNIDPIGKR